MLAVLCLLLPAGAAALAIPPTEAAASTARPDDSVLLPFTDSAEMALDDAHGHLFFFGYAPGDEIVVTDLAGKVLTRIRPGSGAIGALALAPDSSRLYVAFGTGGISEFDTVTLEQTRHFDTPGVHALELAAGSGRLWFTYCCDSTSSTDQYGIGSVDLSASPATVRIGQITAHFLSQLSVASSRLAVTDVIGRQLNTYDISSGEVELLATRRFTNSLADLTLNHDGTQVVTALSNGTGPGHQVWNTDDLSPAGSYDTQGTETTMALSADDSLVAAGSTAPLGDDVWVYRRGGTTPLQAIDLDRLDGSVQFLVRDGMALTSDASRLFVLTDDSDVDGPRLYVIRDPWRYDSDLSVDVRASAHLGEELTVTGRLSFDQETVSSSYHLQVRRTDRDGTTHALPDVATATDGTYSFTDTPPTSGPHSYVVSFDGDDSHPPDRATDAVRVFVAWDTDGDDRANLVTGAPGEDVGTVSNAGTFWELDTTAAGVTATGAHAYTKTHPEHALWAEATDAFGAPSVSGDFNADGYADVVVGMPGEDSTHANAGGALLFHGSPTGLTNDVNVIGTGGGTNARAGFALAAGDFNGDGYDDLAFSAPGRHSNTGDVYLLDGSPDNRMSVAPAFKLTQQDVELGSADNPDEDFGAALAAGDANGDGIDDLAIGIPQNQQERTYPTGAVVVVLGDKTDGLDPSRSQLWNLDSPGVPGAPAPFGTDKPDSFGERLAFGDYNGDRFDDLAIAAPGAPVATSAGTRQDAGAVTVLHGSASGLTPGERVTQQSAGVPGTAETGDRFGAALAAGDTNGDGADELAVTTTGDHLVTLLRGSNAALGSAPDPVWTQDTAGVPGADEAGDQFGAGLRLAWFNGRSAASLLIGVPGENSASGAFVMLYTGGSTGITTTGARAFNQSTAGIPGASEAGDRFGSLVP